MDTTQRISNTDDLIDPRDVIARIDYLESAATNDEDVFDLSHLTDEEREELLALKNLAETGEAELTDWQYGETLIHSDYFETYAQQLAEDIGAVDPNAPWPLTYIDWSAAADALAQDYTEIDFDGATYMARA